MPQATVQASKCRHASRRRAKSKFSGPKYQKQATMQASKPQVLKNRREPDSGDWIPIILSNLDLAYASQ